MAEMARSLLVEEPLWHPAWPLLEPTAFDKRHVSQHDSSDPLAENVLCQGGVKHTHLPVGMYPFHRLYMEVGPLVHIPRQQPWIVPL